MIIQYTKHGNDLFYEPRFRTFFKSSPYAVERGINNFLRGVVTGTALPNFKYLYENLYLEPPEGCEELGWNYDYLASEWASLWIDIIPIPKITDDGIPYLELNYPMEPKPMDYLEGWYD